MAKITVSDWKKAVVVGLIFGFVVFITLWALPGILETAHSYNPVDDPYISQSHGLAIISLFNVFVVGFIPCFILGMLIVIVPKALD